jgi:hypothetical protein
MTEHQANKRTRRRFLADMLFLGGGLTAAGLLAKAQLTQPEPPPAVPGQMMVPTPHPSPEVPVPSQPHPGEMVAPPPPQTQVPDIPPGAAGGMEMPQPTPACVKTPEQENKPAHVEQVGLPPREPNIAGGRMAPQPNDF